MLMRGLPSWPTLGVVLLWLSLLAVTLSLVYTRHQARTLFVELQRLQHERDALDIDWTRLRLEKSIWTHHARVEKVATETLRMVAPDALSISVIAP